MRQPGDCVPDPGDLRLRLLALGVLRAPEVASQLVGMVMGLQPADL